MSIASITAACRLELHDCPDFVIEAEMPRVAREICEHTGIWSDDLAEVTLVDGTTLYDLTLPDTAGLVRVCSLRDPDNLETEVTGLSWRYDEVNQQLFVSETGRSGDTGVVPRVCLYPLTAAAIPECIHTECSQAMEYGTLYRLFLRPKLPWSDGERAAYYGNLYRSEWARKKIKLLRGSRTGSLSVTPRVFA